MIYAFNDSKEKINLLDYFYPVGSIYETSSDSFNPGTRWGGTWVKVQDKVLVGAGSLFPSGQTGGHMVVTYTPAGTVGDHTLTVDEIPSHTHVYTKHNTTIQTDPEELPIGEGATLLDGITSTNSGGTGGGQAHGHTFTGTQAALDNMPPYEVINIWKRIA